MVRAWRSGDLMYPSGPLLMEAEKPDRWEADSLMIILRHPDLIQTPSSLFEFSRTHPEIFF